MTYPLMVTGSEETAMALAELIGRHIIKLRGDPTPVVDVRQRVELDFEVSADITWQECDQVRSMVNAFRAKHMPNLWSRRTSPTSVRNLVEPFDPRKRRRR